MSNSSSCSTSSELTSYPWLKTSTRKIKQVKLYSAPPFYSSSKKKTGAALAGGSSQRETVQNPERQTEREKLNDQLSSSESVGVSYDHMNTEKVVIVQEEVVGCRYGQQPGTSMTSSLGPAVVNCNLVSKSCFIAVLCMVDSRGECLVNEGQYAIPMRKCTNGNDSASTSEPLSSSTMFVNCKSSKVMINVQTDAS